MIPHRPAVEQRILAALHAVPARIPCLVGPTGAGRTSLLLHLRETLGSDRCQYVNVERAASTPERFYAALTTHSPFPSRPLDPPPAGGTARHAFDAALAFIGRRHGDTGSTFLLDEALEFRTFESFPGLRRTLRELVDALDRSGNRFVISTRYVQRARRLLKDASSRFEVIEIPPMSAVEVRAVLPAASEQHVAEELDELGAAVTALTTGRPLYVEAVAEAMARDQDRISDPVGTLTGLLASDGALARTCLALYELRLHRARGYGALKAILEVLAEEEPLTLTAIAQRMHRTPGSTKDYLTWLEDVDLIAVDRKRYSFTDPLLRLWVRLHCRPEAPSLERVAREVQEYALARLPRGETRWVDGGTRPSVAAPAPVPVGVSRAWEMLEID